MSVTNNVRPFAATLWRQVKGGMSYLAGHLLFGRRAGLLAAFFLLVTLVIIGRILVTNWELIKAYQWQFRPVWLIYALLFFLLDLLLATWAWHLLTVRLASYDNFRQSAKICWSANLARRIPGPIWYIAGRALLYEKEGVSKATISLLSALELLFFLVSGLITVALTLPFWALPAALISHLSHYWFFLLLLPLSFLCVHPRFLEKVWQNLNRTPLPKRLRWRDTTAWLWLYVLTWIVGAFVLFSVINLVQPLPPGKIIAIIGVWALAGSVSLAGSLTISIIGLREASLALLLTQLIPAPIALIVAVAVRIIWLAGEFLSVLLAWRL